MLALARCAALLALLVVFSGPVVAHADDPQPALEPVPVSFDRSTPQRAMRSYLLAERSGNHTAARYALELSHLSPEQQRSEGTRLARELKRVLDRVLWVDVDALSDEPASEVGQRVEVGPIPYRETAVPLVMVSVLDRDDDLVWVVASSVVARVPELYAEHGPALLEQLLPAWASRHRVWELELWQLFGMVLAMTVGLALGRLFAWLLIRAGTRVAERTDATWDDELMRALQGPTRFLIAVVLAWLLVEPLRLAAPAQELVDHVLQMALVGSVAWMAVRMVHFAGYLLQRRAEQASADQPDADLRLRGLRTQVMVLRRVVSIVIGIVAAALMLTQFEVVRSVGLSLLASAGMAGIVIGLAAQRSIATLLAGIQLSITQPIRIGDTVIVENEWGFIEEINLTYVVVKVWDERRLVVPMSRFLEQPFQNWTKVAPQLLGTVFFHADYRLPIEAVRKELARILDGNPKWDGRAQGIVVTDAKDRTLEVRALISAKNAGDQWDLRCEVREKLIAWLRDYEGGRYLPRVRVEGETATERAAAAS